MSMNPEIKAQWTAALRSGEYAQGQGFLTKVAADGKQADCCLGVLCKLAIKAGVELDVAPAAIGDYLRYGSEPSTLPKKVQDWAGIEDCNPVIPWVKGMPVAFEQRGRISLAELNDYDPEVYDGQGQCYGFTEIADVIENNDI